jgi:DNA-binding MarR family transcriptional regulator
MQDGNIFADKKMNCKEPHSLSATHKNAWIALFVASKSLVKKIDRTLESSGQVAIELYEVLLLLGEAPDGRLRMCDLAERTLLSRSGMTRLVDRLERLGYIRRQPSEIDRRSLYAVITPEGVEAREAAWAVFREAVAEEFAASLTVVEARSLIRILGRFAPEDMRIGWGPEGV